MSRFRTFWKAAKLPLTGLALLLITYTLWTLFELPPQDVIIAQVRDWISRYGAPVVLAGSFLESLLVVGWYFPGSIIIFLSVILAPSPTAAAFSVLLVTIGLYTGYTLNFFLGRYGWYRLLVFLGIREQLEEAQKTLERYGLRAIFMSYWAPSLAAFTSTAAGILRFNPARFLVYSLAAVVLWNCFWGTVVYILGEKALDTVLTWPFVLAIIAAWVLARYVDALLVARKAKS